MDGVFRPHKELQVGGSFRIAGQDKDVLGVRSLDSHRITQFEENIGILPGDIEDQDVRSLDPFFDRLENTSPVSCPKSGNSDFKNVFRINSAFRFIENLTHHALDLFLQKLPMRIESACFLLGSLVMLSPSVGDGDFNGDSE